MKDRFGLPVHPDIAQARTLRGPVYTDPKILEVLRERIFARGWHFVTDLDHLKVPGKVFPFTLLEGLLDEPLVLTRDRSDRLHCLSNVCTHRGALVVEHEGVEQGLRCRYHGRRFQLDGRFHSMPEFEAVKDFPQESDNLRPIEFRTWGKFVFVSLQPEMSFEDWISPMRQRCQWMPLENCILDRSRSRDYLVRANWALYCENYLEGFHIPYVHSGLAGVLDYGSYRTELFPRATLQVGVAGSADDVFDLPDASPDSGQNIAAYYFWLFPNLMFNFYPWGISINIVQPLAVDRTRVSFLAYVWDSSRLEQGAGASLDRVEREDEVVVESVQRGMKSRYYPGGRYSPRREEGVHHFHRLLARFLEES